ncbi:unnamed protein product [Chrysoparadoxa australica]
MKKQYGLLGSAKSLSAARGRGRGRGRGAAKPVPRKVAPGVFGDDSDSDNDGGEDREVMNRRLQEAAAARDRANKVLQTQALAENPDIYDYDGMYDEMHGKKEQEKEEAAKKDAKKQPRYISQLLQKAKMREVEQDKVYDRKLAKEREEEAKIHGEVDAKFVTGAYKKKLMEQKKWDLAQQQEEEREAKNDVRKAGMSGFYANLLTKNVAMGGDVEQHATSAFTTGSKRHAAVDEYEMNDKGAPKNEVKAEAEAKVKDEVGGEDEGERISPEEERARKRARREEEEAAEAAEEARKAAEEEKNKVVAAKAAAEKKAEMIAAARARALARKKG